MRHPQKAETRNAFYSALKYTSPRDQAARLAPDSSPRTSATMETSFAEARPAMNTPVCESFSIHFIGPAFKAASNLG